MAGDPTSLAQRYGLIAFVVSSYFVVSILMVFVNKSLMTMPGASIPAPMFVVWFQCVFTVFICWGMGKAGASGVAYFKDSPLVSYDFAVGRKVMPLSIIFVGMISFNQLCLQYVEVSFYNVARSLTIVFNVVFTFIFLRKATSPNALLTLLVVIVGFFVGADGEINFSVIGTVFGVLSSACVALNSVFTSSALVHVGNDKNLLIFYNNVNSCILFVPLILLAESKVLLASWALLTSSFFWTMMCLAGVLGYLIGVVTVWQIQVTSPLTHNISGTAKACLQTVLAYFIWRNQPTVASAIGVVLVLGGSVLYAWVRIIEEQSEKAAAAGYKPIAAPAHQNPDESSTDTGPTKP